MEGNKRIGEDENTYQYPDPGPIDPNSRMDGIKARWRNFVNIPPEQDQTPDNSMYTPPYTEMEESIEHGIRMALLPMKQAIGKRLSDERMPNRKSDLTYYDYIVNQDWDRGPKNTFALNTKDHMKYFIDSSGEPFLNFKAGKKIYSIPLYFFCSSLCSERIQYSHDKEIVYLPFIITGFHNPERTDSFTKPYAPPVTFLEIPVPELMILIPKVGELL